jgi:hypothetical protein
MKMKKLLAVAVLLIGDTIAWAGTTNYSWAGVQQGAAQDPTKNLLYGTFADYQSGLKLTVSLPQ